MEWLPGTGVMTLAATASGLYALGITVLALLVSLFSPERCKEQDRSWIMIGVTALAMVGTTVAFLAEHFLLRYVALEIVALCVALTPLLARGDVRGRRSSWAVYLSLRVGDAGLLAAILALYGAVGTLDIEQALAMGKTLSPARLDLVAIGFVLAVGVKMGLGPFSLWLHAGRRLGQTHRAWFYLTLMPNLGLYLLYKTTPLLAASVPARTGTLWVGLAIAVTTCLFALLRRDLDGAEVSLWGIQGGLILWVAALGLKPLVWVSLIIWTLLRLFSVWALDLARAGNRTEKRVAAGMLLLCGVVLAMWNGLLLAWGRPLAGAAAWFGAQLGVALTLIWIGDMVWQTFSTAESSSCDQPPAYPVRLWAAGGLGAIILCGVVLARPLLAHLFDVAHFEVSESTAWLRVILWSPAVPAAALLAWGVRALRKRWSTGIDRGIDVLDQVSARVSWERIVSGIGGLIERRFLEGMIGIIVQAVMSTSAWLHHWLEMGSLEGLLRWAVRAIHGASAWLLRWLEQASLEGLLRWSVVRIRSMAQHTQRFHAGRLRVNLIWAVLGLALTVLVFAVWLR